MGYSQIIEHTEFIDDATLKPFSYPKHYYKRCAQLKIQSGGKVAYVHPDQLSLPENYKASGFPDKFLVDGFLVCVDVSCESTEMEVEFVENLLTSLAALKKPLVVAFTKFDQAKPNTVQAMQELLAKMKRQAPPTVEVSALKGINVDLSFLLLAHLIDSKKSSSRLVNYAVAKQNLDDRISSCERSFQDLLDRELNDFTLPLEPALTRFSGSPEYKLVVELCGNQRSRKLVQAKLNYGKKKQVQKLTEEFFGRLPRILMELLPELDLDATPEQCKERLKQSSAFGNYFCEEKNWEENIPFLARATPLIPFSLVSDNSTNSRSTEIIKTYIDKILLVKRQKLAYDRLKVALATASQLKPGMSSIRSIRFSLVWYTCLGIALIVFSSHLPPTHLHSLSLSLSLSISLSPSLSLSLSLFLSLSFPLSLTHTRHTHILSPASQVLKWSLSSRVLAWSMMPSYSPGRHWLSCTVRR